MDFVMNKLFSPKTEKDKKKNRSGQTDRSSFAADSVPESYTSATSDADNESVSSAVYEGKELKELKFLEIRAALKKKGIKYSRTDTKEVLLGVLQTIYENESAIGSPSSGTSVMSQLPPVPVSIQSTVHSTPSAKGSTASTRSTAKAAKTHRDSVSHYGLRSGDIHYSLRSHDGSAHTPHHHSAGQSHNIDDDFVYDPATTFHEKRHHRKSLQKSPGKSPDGRTPGPTSSSSARDEDTQNDEINQGGAEANYSDDEDRQGEEQDQQEEEQFQQQMDTMLAKTEPAAPATFFAKQQEEETAVVADPTSISQLLMAATQELPILEVESDSEETVPEDQQEMEEEQEDVAADEEEQEDVAADEAADDEERENVAADEVKQHEHVAQDVLDVLAEEEEESESNDDNDDLSTEPGSEGDSEEDEGDDDGDFYSVEEEDEDEEDEEQEEQVLSMEGSDEQAVSQSSGDEMSQSDREEGSEGSGSEEEEEEREYSQEEEESDSAAAQFPASEFNSGEVMDLVSSDDEQQEQQHEQQEQQHEQQEQPVVSAPAAPNVSAVSATVETPVPSAPAAVQQSSVPSVAATVESAAPVLSATAAAALAAFSKLGSTFATLVAAQEAEANNPQQQPSATLSEKEYDLLKTLLERSKPATLIAASELPPAPQPAVSAVASVVTVPSETVVRKSVTFGAVAEDKKNEVVAINGSESEKGVKSLYFASQVETIPSRTSFEGPWMSRDSFTPQKATEGFSFTSTRRIVTTPYSKFRSSTPGSIGTAGDNTASVHRRLPTPYHNKHTKPVFAEDEMDQELRPEEKGDNSDLAAFSHSGSSRKRSFFTSEVQDNDADSNLLGMFPASANKRMSIESGRHSIGSFSVERLTYASNSTPVRLSQSPQQNSVPVGSGISAPQFTSTPVTFNMGAPPTSRIPQTGSARSSYLPKFKEGATRFNSFQAPIATGSVAVKKTSPSAQTSLSYIQRRRLQRQSVGDASAVVAKKILETLGTLTTNIEQERKRPLALAWRDAPALEEAVEEKEPQPQSRPTPSKAATLGAPVAEKNGFGYTAPAAPQFPVAKKDDEVKKAVESGSTEDKKAAALKTSKIPSFGFKPPTGAAPAEKKSAAASSFFGASVENNKVAETSSTSTVSVHSTKQAESAPVPTLSSDTFTFGKARAPAFKNASLPSTSASASSSKTVGVQLQAVDSEFTFNDPQEVNGFDDVSSSSILGKRATLSPSQLSAELGSSAIRFAFSPPSKHRKSGASASSKKADSTDKTGGVTAAAAAAAPKVSVESAAPAVNIWAASSINDGIKCGACMVKNKKDATRCASCETPLTSSSTASVSANAGAKEQSTGGVNIWAASSLNDGIKCSACMVRNKKDATKCVSCETPLTSGGAASGSSGSGFGFSAPATAAPTSGAISSGGFTFGSAAPASASSTTTSPAASGFGSGGFAFGTKKDDAAAPAKSGFQFGQPATVASSVTPSFSFGSAAPAPAINVPPAAVNLAPKPAFEGFSFGKSVDSAPIAADTAKVATADSSSVSSLGSFGAQKNKVSFGAFSESSSAATAAEEEKPAKRKSFISWDDEPKVPTGPKASDAFPFGSTTPATAPAASTGFGFGGGAAPAATFGSFGTAAAPAHPAKTAPAASTFQFGAAPAAQDSSKSSFATSTPAFGSTFGSAAKPALATIPEDKPVSTSFTASNPFPSSGFGAAATAPSATSGFGFGTGTDGNQLVKRPSSDSLTSAAPFGAGFGQPPAPATTSAPFSSFGAATSTPAFGAAPSATTPAFGATTTSTPAFGSFASSAASAAPASGSIFGGAASLPKTDNPLPSFGGFGNNAVSAPFGSSSGTASSGFGAPSGAFGAVPTPAAGTNAFSSSFGSAGGFGAATQPSSTLAFGGAPAASTAFGGNSAGAFGAPAQQPAFGAAPQTSSAGMFGTSSTPSFGASTFGGAPVASTFGSSAFGGSSTPAFGAPASGFGGSSGGFGAPASNFGGPPASSFGAPNSGGFSMGVNSGSNNNLAGLAQNDSNSSFSLGAAGDKGARRKVKAKRPGQP